MDSKNNTRVYIDQKNRQYIPAFVGKSGREVHAAFLSSKVVNSRGELVSESYGQLCTIVNTHNVNKHPRLHLAGRGTEITCKKCLAKLAEIEAAKVQEFSENLYAGLGMAGVN
jgi:hypothetical protein